ncbi:hypothetical protein LR48_Vigan08g109100 [Vigna angularis]|uniref:DUF8039 domain-containing protein n=1 Tax=Phaseolus angularis TaxID=3914 RepID=A0A0L9V6E7_PHAAN|nr:hypothetical protein LR48_Vigan08g109100 [Vigna angularis]
MVVRQFQQQFEHYGNRPAPSPIAEHDVPLQLYILYPTGTMLVARGIVYEAAIVVHGVELAEDEVKVTVDEVVQTGQEGSPTPKKTHLCKDDPLGVLDELVNIIADASVIVPWDSTTFGRDVEISLYLHQQYVRELALGREEINIILVHLWMMRHWQLLVISIPKKTLLSGFNHCTSLVPALLDK